MRMSDARIYSHDHELSLAGIMRITSSVIEHKRNTLISDVLHICAITITTGMFYISLYVVLANGQVYGSCCDTVYRHCGSILTD